MTEPGIGSDLAAMSTSARRDGDHYLVNGSKTFITNGINADLVITAVKTDPSERHRGISLLVIERGMEGFERGRNLEKIGQHAQDTAELSFTDVRVPVENLLGAGGRGLSLPRLQPPPGAPLDRRLRRRRRRGRARLDARLRARAQGLRPVDRLVPELALHARRDPLAKSRSRASTSTAARRRSNDGELTPEDAAMAKWWCTDLQGRVVDRCLQLFGGYGYMLEYPIARAFADARVTRIYGGANEIMKEIVGRSLGL